MLYFLSKESRKIKILSWFLAYATDHGVSEKLAGEVCILMANQLEYNRIIHAERLLEILKKLNSRPDVRSAQAFLRLASWKFQGTDGVRGIVSPERTGTLESLWLFINKGIITQTFCTIYALALSRMLTDLPQDTRAHFPPGSPENKIVLGEDGRDFFSKTGLKKSIIEGFRYSGISVVDLGIVPTPGVVLYCLKYDLPGIMLTASHNPSEYNGMKVFLNGRKLYPEGVFGEYLLSWTIFSIAMEGNSFKGLFFVTIDHPGIVIEIKEEVEKDLIGILETPIDGEKLKSLKSISIVLDTANGAYTQTALRFFLDKGIKITPVNCEPGEDSINKNCGVGVLEQLDAVLEDDEGYPIIVRELFSKGRLSPHKKAFGISLDGDGDRGFLLEYESEKDVVNIYDGDAIGYLILSGMVRESTTSLDPSLRFVCTVESDPALLHAVENNLHIATDTTCVGDRWLLSEKSTQEQLILGCERSGHIIIPTPIPENTVIDSKKVLYTGNGLSSTLAAIINMLRLEDNPGITRENIFVPGYRSQVIFRNCEMNKFYRDSELWERVKDIVHEIITLNCREKFFIHEMDMLYFNVLDTGNKLIGRWYMRKSGTEPKISFCFYMLTEYKLQCTNWMTKLKQEISSLLRQNSLRK